MNLHQFRFVREAVRQNFNLTTAAKALFTSQPGVSKAIIELEDELGVEIFRRHGKRIRSLTEPGKRILISIERILDEVETLKRVGKDFSSQDQALCAITTFGVGLALLFIVLEFVALKAAINADKRRND